MSKLILPIESVAADMIFFLTCSGVSESIILLFSDLVDLLIFFLRILKIANTNTIINVHEGNLFFGSAGRVKILAYFC